MQPFLCFLGERVAIFSCFATFLGESRHKNNSFLLIWEIALHWEWNIFVRMQRFWTLETICVAWSKLPARWCAKESPNLSPHKLRHATSQAKPARSRALLKYKYLICKNCLLSEIQPTKLVMLLLLSDMQDEVSMIFWHPANLLCTQSLRNPLSAMLFYRQFFRLTWWQHLHQLTDTKWSRLHRMNLLCLPKSMCRYCFAVHF